MAPPLTTTNEPSIVPVITAGIITMTLLIGFLHHQALQTPPSIPATSTQDVSTTAVTPTETAIPEPNYEIIPGERFGELTAFSTIEDVIRLYGVNNVQAGNVDLGEGILKKGTLVFPNDPQKRFEILWLDETKQALPATIRVSGEHSNWTVDNRITLGTTLQALETINTRSFKLLGFGWDYGGSITSWEGGYLEKLMQRKNQIFLRLGYPDKTTLSDTQFTSISGDQELLSSNPLLQRLNPHLEQIVVSFLDLDKVTNEAEESETTEIPLPPSPIEPPLESTATTPVPLPTPTPTLTPIPSPPVPSSQDTPNNKQKTETEKDPTPDVDKDAIPDYPHKYTE